MLNVQWVPIGTLKLNPRNARTHQNKQVKQIADSINAFGWTAPIVLDENSMILAGHGRYLAATRLGQKNAPVIVKIGLSDTQKRALAIADNKIASNADWDRAQLTAELGELATLLPECNLDLQITGFEAAEIDSFMVDHVDPEQDPTDEIPPLKAVAVSQRGDCWRAWVIIVCTAAIPETRIIYERYWTARAVRVNRIPAEQVERLVAAAIRTRLIDRRDKIPGIVAIADATDQQRPSTGREAPANSRLPRGQPPTRRPRL